MYAIRSYYDNSQSTVIIVDNSCLAMTGGQNVASSDFGFNYKPENKIDIAKVCEAVGIKDIVTVDPYQIDKLEEAILNAVNAKTNSVVIVKKECITKFKLPKNKPSYIDQDLCVQCRKCINIGCRITSYNVCYTKLLRRMLFSEGIKLRC